jgi:hypothetical protein
MPSEEAMMRRESRRDCVERADATRRLSEPMPGDSSKAAAGPFDLHHAIATSESFDSVGVAMRRTDPIDRHVDARLRMTRLMLNLSQTEIASALGLKSTDPQQPRR